eukprot:1856134-Lingulodinium_polyedra.AAC.1
MNSTAFLAAMGGQYPSETRTPDTAPALLNARRRTNALTSRTSGWGTPARQTGLAGKRGDLVDANGRPHHARPWDTLNPAQIARA